jgi:hypothetical protein
MKFVSHRRRRMAVSAHANPEVRHILKRGRSGALILGLAATAAVAAPAAASASAGASTTGASPVIGHVYVDDNTAGTNTIGAFDRHADGTLTPSPGLRSRPAEPGQAPGWPSRERFRSRRTAGS